MLRAWKIKLGKIQMIYLTKSFSQPRRARTRISAIADTYLSHTQQMALITFTQPYGMIMKLCLIIGLGSLVLRKG
jgi:hypothetical protein